MAKSVVIIGTRGYPSYYGGFETAVRKIAPYLAERGWEVSVYGRPNATKLNDPELDPRVQTPLTRGFETKSLSTLSYGLTATLHAAKRRPDVALVMNVANGFWLPILKSRGIRTVVNVDGIEWERAKWGRMAKATFKHGAKLTARFGDRLICDSVEIAKTWKDSFDRDSDFIPYGGDVPANLPLEAPLEHRKYVLAVARFVPENTVAEFLDAAERVSKVHDVVIVGSSGYGSELDERAVALAKSNPRFHALGHVSDDRRLLALWQHAGAYFHGHSVGGTNPALVQAMAAGSPILARDTKYNREVLSGAGLFAEPSPDAIVSGLGRLMSSPESQEKFSSLAVARAQEHYSWKGVCSRYEASLLKAIGAA